MVDEVDARKSDLVREFVYHVDIRGKDGSPYKRLVIVKYHPDASAERLSALAKAFAKDGIAGADKVLRRWRVRQEEYAAALSCSPFRIPRL